MVVSLRTALFLIIWLFQYYAFQGHALLDNPLHPSNFGIIIGTELKDENFFILDVDINPFGEIFALA
jgi:hypothetical protein